jgi:hypothetical protein
MRHIENMAKVMLATGLIVCTATRASSSSAGTAATLRARDVDEPRMFDGYYAWSYWALLLCNFIVPQLLW